MLTADEAAVEIKREINDDPTIQEPQHIIVTVAKKKGFSLAKKKPVIILDGKVHTEKDRQKAEEIARHCAGVMELSNEIQLAE